ncbi:metal-dependent hydrolase [Psittacicella gerlachiana]|uniref:LexA-binding, inner membrane-associated hydrolase n=1 Tax=Psittacicella gerlachiana TaxID=2028574 RepID=A0A3A1Y1S8_9GAMM|nr:metal-dependent hydrolase [Psittacicella gerlachiana]RIY31370.1 hypothetical protein CKF59_07685 [Psittacicella gerlachiana]
MYRVGHSVTGANLGVCITLACANWLHFPFLISILAGYLAYKGSNAPDYLEMRWYDRKHQELRTLIPHRTLTHWFVPWLALGAYATYQVSQGSVYWVLVASYCAGALLHIILDLPNKKPILGLLPHTGICLKWWGSHEHQFLICCFTTVLMGIFIYYCFQGSWEYIANNPVTVVRDIWYQIMYEANRLVS